MKIRFLEQGLSSLATFLVSLLALRAFGHDALSQFFLVVCGCQIAAIVGAARTITPLVSRNPLALWRVTRRRTISGEVIILAAAATLLLYLTPAPAHQTALDKGLFLLALFAYAATLLAFDWWRRVGAVLRIDIPSTTYVVPQMLRCAGIAGAAAAFWQWSASPSLILLMLASAQFAAAVFTRRQLLLDEHALAVSAGVKAESGAPERWSAIGSEALVALAWANIPIFLLAQMSGSLSVAQLVAVRTPLSFFNPLIEYVEVHARHRMPALSGVGRLRLALLIAAVWSTLALAIYWKGDMIVRAFSAGSYQNLSAELTLFWWMLLAALVDRMTHNIERLRHLQMIKLAAVLGVIVGMTLVSGFLIHAFGTLGCIAAMALWCIVNALPRLLHEQRN